MKKIGIIGAMSVEVELLRNEMNNVSTHKIGRLEFWDGLIGGVSVVVVKSGVGKVNAALCTQMLIDRFAVTHVINTGVAGAFALVAHGSQMLLIILLGIYTAFSVSLENRKTARC